MLVSLNRFIFFFLLSKISFGRSSEISKFFLFNFPGLDITSSRWGYFKKLAIIGGKTLSNTMNPLEFDLVWIFHDKLCFKESNQNLSRVLLRIGFFTSEKNEQGFSRRWYTSMYSFSSLSWLISHFSLSNFSLKDSHSVFAKSNPSSSSLIFFSVFFFSKTRNNPPLPANYSLFRQLLLHTVPNFQVFPTLVRVSG